MIPTRASALSFVAATVLFAAEAWAIEPAACLVQSTSYMDGLMNPPKGSDEQFFTSPSGPPNAHLIIDNSFSMTAWPVRLCEDQNAQPGYVPSTTYVDSEGRGCDCKPLEDLKYDRFTPYPPEINNINSGTFFGNWFANPRVYQVPHGYYWQATWAQYSATANDNAFPAYYGFTVGNGTEPGGENWSGTGTLTSAITAACASTSGTGQALAPQNVALCQTCLAQKGYYLEAGDADFDFNMESDEMPGVLRRRMTGNFLNYFSQRYTMARNVVKQVVRDIRRVRLSTSTFRIGSDEPKLMEYWNPACSQIDNNASWDSNRQSVLNGITPLRFDHGQTPLARALLVSGFLFNNLPASGPVPYDTIFGSRSNWQSPMNLSNTDVTAFEEQGTNDNQKSVCFPCTFNAAIVLTDGEPNGPEDDAVPAPIGDPANEINWDDCNGIGEPENCKNSDLDEVAKMLWNRDMRAEMAGKQKVATYTIAFGLDSAYGTKLLRHTAEAGEGQYFQAQSSSQLKNALLSIFENINTRNTSFASASVNSLQSGSGSLTALLPRMSPQRNKPWKGFLYRFDLFNEFVLDQDHPGDADTLKNDVYIVDTSGEIVEEDSEGKFIRKGSTVAATPRWEASERLRAKGHGGRQILTTIDRDGNGALNQLDNPPLPFTAANSAALINYLAIKGAPFCPTSELFADRGRIFGRLNLTWASAATAVSMPVTVPPTRAELDSLCAKVLIQYIRGQDLGDEDNDNNRTETRDSILSDIFHSSPIMVSPPVDKFLCSLGFAAQCVRTLYGHDTSVPATPLASYANVTDPCDSSRLITVDAYERWRIFNKNRDRAIVFGSNSGMLHVLHDGDGTAACPGGKLSVEHPPSTSTGDELLAYIPVDILPRLKELVFGHTYLVDGDTMVRDIWADADNDGIKDCDDIDTCEFHTMVVGTEGRGGTHYFALELRFDASGNLISPVPASSDPYRNSFFRWTFPQPNSKEAALFGKTLNAISPKPPPIGPVLLKSTGAYAAGGPVTRRGVPTHERWVALLSGGWSPSLERGRGVYMVDIWEGDLSGRTGRSDNLWWKFEFDDGASGGQNEPRKHLDFSVAAPVALVDYGGRVGSADDIRVDGYFDTAVFGDTGGQLWVLRFFEPGAPPASTGMVNNWAGARAFEMDRYGTVPNVDESGVSTNSASIANKWPFYYLPSLTIQPDNNALRAFVGTGNRYALLEPGIGKCRFDNPIACAKSSCDAVKTVYQVNRLDTNVSKLETHWANVAFLHGKLDSSAASNTACGTVGTTSVTAAFAEHSVGVCENGGLTVTIGDLRQTRVTCGQRATDEFLCEKDPLMPPENYDNLTVAPDPASTLGTLGKNRYYGVWIYGGQGTVARRFTESATSGATSAATFDSGRLTDRSASDATSGNLVDVTAITCDASGNCSGPGAPDRGTILANGQYEGMGWIYEYPAHAYKTASGSSLLAGCALWNDLLPPATTTPCDVSSLPSGRIYQADFLSGLPNCAAGFRNTTTDTWARNIERPVIAPPPEPAMAVQVNSRGEIRYSALLVEPGQGDGVSNFTIGGEDEAVQIIYELPVSQPLHDCRHTANGCVTLSP